MNGYDFVASLVQSFASLAWPVALVAGVYLFREKITEILPTLRVRHKETELSFQQAQVAHTPHPSLPEITDPHPLPTVNARLQDIQADLSGVDEELKIPVLSRALAVAQVGVNFEFIFSVIFQSQIDFLRVLERKSITAEEAHKFFEEHPVLSSDHFKEWNFQKWADFLVSQGLIQTGYEISLAQKGRDFLRFVDVEKAGFMRPN